MRAVTNSQHLCNHNELERSLTGTWVTEEVSLALKKGYKIIKAYELWHFEQTSSDLFKDYLLKLFKLKVECEGFPDGIVSDEEKDNYVTEYFTTTNIKLDKENICKNPGMREIAKLCINAMLGKLGQRNDFPKTEYINVVEDPHKYNALLFDPTLKVNVIDLSDKIVQVTHQKTDDYSTQINYDASVYMAAFITTYGRIKLYEALDILQDKVLNFDTDSVFFIQKNGEELLKTGPALGQFKDELGGDYITRFCSAGPKNHSYECSNPSKNCVKIKGITLNYGNSDKIGVEEMFDIVVGNSSHIDFVNESKITRDRKTKEVYNRRESKKYRFVYDKRVVPDPTDGFFKGRIDTLPFGF